jgi:histidyl-tRNA synthetase
MSKELPTEPYKGTRDFYPEEMAIQRYIFDTWAETAELFGFERYDASVLEPSELYKSKGAENEELVNEQTYTFTDRGDREVTLRPEMTPTVARMVAGKRRELHLPVRWYSIPNLFRYERPQRGRLREHWQLNCDLFGESDIAADIEMISLAYTVLTAFGATPDMFEIRVNDRNDMRAFYTSFDITDETLITAITRLNDRKNKISPEEYTRELTALVGAQATEIEHELTRTGGENSVTVGLNELGIHNVRIDRTLSRGFDYYTGTIFEIFDTSTENNRSLLGGGRYDNLTGLFGGDPIPGIGFGMGDVTVHDFLVTHKLLPEHVKVTAPTLVIIPTDPIYNIEGLKVAETFRSFGIRTSVDTSTRKIGKKIGAASDRGSTYVLVVGENEIDTRTFILKNLATQDERTGTLEELASQA